MSQHIKIPICTGMGSARNSINVLSSDVVVACEGSAGTLSEIALALKHDKRVIILSHDGGRLISGHVQNHDLIYVKTAKEAVTEIKRIFFPDDVP